MELIFATNNQNKTAEINKVAGSRIKIISLAEAGIEADIPEPYPTLEENAFAKSLFIYRLTRKNCFSEDTGLEVDALAGAPGVKSARYAGEPVDMQKNIELLLKNLEGISNRKARFRTVISLILDKVEYQFAGICEGHIGMNEKGTNGFGYDSLFTPEGTNRTFAEMNMEEKNRFSHRKKATEKLIAFLKNYHGQAEH